MHSPKPASPPCWWCPSPASGVAAPKPCGCRSPPATACCASAGPWRSNPEPWITTASAKAPSPGSALKKWPLWSRPCRPPWDWREAAALGFLLLLPLQPIAGLKTSRSLNNTQAARIQGAEAKLKALRQAVAGAASNADLNKQLQKLEGPVLGPADIAQPLPLLKAQVGAVLDQAALQISREREASQPRTPLLLLPDLLRNGLASLALALGFAALARRPGSRRTVLQELQSGWRRSWFGRSGRRRRGSSGSGG